MLNLTVRCKVCGLALTPIYDDDHGIVDGYCSNACTECDAHKDEAGNCPNGCDEPDTCVECGNLAGDCACG